jgi:hypothetical protein
MVAICGLSAEGAADDQAHSDLVFLTAGSERCAKHLVFATSSQATLVGDWTR